jgi:cyanophycin synthetase
VRRDDNLRGRTELEVPHLIRDHLIEAGVAPERIEVIPDEQEAVAAALEHAQRGDLLLIFGDNIARCWKQVVTFSSSETETEKTEDMEAHPVVLDFELPDSITEAQFEALIIDERGVRLALEESAD